MKNRKVLVTGGSRGIGKVIVEQLIKQGYEVYAPTRDELELASAESIRAFVNAHAEDGYDIIINNAGINDIHNIDEITDDEIERTMNINLIAPMKLLRAFVPTMKNKNYGKIVNVGSIWGVVSKGGRVMYSASKHGIHGITKTLAVELAPYNILVNTVCPGFTLTELTYKNNTPEQISDISQDIPMGRMAQPEEIANVICYLVSEQNTYLTGQQITVDGGFTSK